MTIGEIVSSILSILALTISGITAYLTLLSRFRATVLPKRRSIFTQVEGVPCIVLECEFINDGAKPGSIEDVLLRMYHTETGLQVIFVPVLVRDHFNINQIYQATDFSAFSGISLGARQRREQFILFKPNQQNFEPSAEKVVVRTSICTNINTKKWLDSPTRLSFNITDGVAKEWASPTGSPQQVTATEIGLSRLEYLKKSQS